MKLIRIIKKYPNRRLYDTKTGTYITLDEIKKLVIKHINFKVIDARSEKDLTQNTLLQVISEQETTTTPLFTTPLLQEFIRFYNEKSNRVLSAYLEQMMRLYSQQKKLVTNSLLPFQELLANPPQTKKIVKKRKKVKKSKRKVRIKKT